jgi:hypothetical protein
MVAGCAAAIVPRMPARQQHRGDALLVLPGFGYSRGGERALRALAPAIAGDGISVFVPTYISRSGLGNSRANLEQFLETEKIGSFDHLYVFAFLAGAWTFNPLETAEHFSNLTAVIYDRSPYQERAPAIARDRLHFLTWLRYGSPVFDLAATPYPVLATPGVRVGVMVETKPTSFIQHHAEAARGYGPFQFGCDAFSQPHDDCMYVDMSHDEMYLRFDELWPEIRAFIRSGRFTGGANRIAPAGDRLNGERSR